MSAASITNLIAVFTNDSFFVYFLRYSIDRSIKSITLPTFLSFTIVFFYKYRKAVGAG